ncbi:MAG TPA: hypothetical protein P5210_16405 [Draconibacterium sp.]|nr:hypothetical protein [Draconibacterium sp.]
MAILKKLLKILKYLFITLIVVIAAVLIWFLAKPAWNHFVTYPRLQEKVSEFQKLRKEPVNNSKLNVYRGVMHLHSYLSHDSEGTLNDLIPAAKNNGIEFMFLTDHPRYDLDTFPRGYNGVYEGVLIEPGSEKHGYVAWPLDSVVIDLKTNPDTIAKEIALNGGIVFFSHTEEKRNWGNPYYQGMEIYNFHTDTKDETLAPHIFNFVVNGKKYRIWALREMFDEQTRILARWDSLNMTRKMVGFSAVDTHENQNIRARYIAGGKVEWVGPNAKIIDTTKVTILNKWMFHEPDKSGWIFRLMIDTYNEGFDYITNYVFADVLSAESLARNIKSGHLYTAFKTLGDAKGFNFYATGKDGKLAGIMGDSINISNLKTLNAVTPLPGRYKLIHNGQTIKITETDSYVFSLTEPFEKGFYRVEVHVNIGGKYFPWIYSNPVYLF